MTPKAAAEKWGISERRVQILCDINYLWKGRIAIEMKSRGKDLSAAHRQLQTSLRHLPDEYIPDIWMVCDFENIRLGRRSTNEAWSFNTRDLRKHIKKVANIAGYATERVRGDQVDVNILQTLGGTASGCR
jgi:hypothetical protein